MNSRTPFITRYRSINRRKTIITAGLAVLALLLAFVALGIGIYNISFIDSITVFFQHITGNITDTKGDMYVWNYRLPRALGALLCGAVLAIGGTVMQNSTNNPLAEPYTMGVSSAALLGATLSMGLGLSLIPGVNNQYTTIINAFLLALCPVLVIMVISSFRKMSSTGIILLGIAMMYLFGSISQYIMVTCTAEDLSEIYNWRVGSLHRLEKHFDSLAIIAATVIPLSAALMLLTKKMDIMYAGDRNAKTMGLEVKTFRVLIMAIVSLITAIVVSFTGTIGFIGLVGPHVARAFVGSNNRYLLPCSAAFGAAFLVAADTIAKVSGPGGLPVGVISAIVGGPLFLYILIRHSKKVWN